MTALVYTYTVLIIVSKLYLNYDYYSVKYIVISYATPCIMIIL